jgi:hypothetical protein
MPVEHFLLDYPIRVPPDLLNSLSHIGVQMFNRNGVWHLADRIGRTYYPNVADLIEEIRRYGLSRRLPATLDFSQLTWDSRILLVHDRAYIENFSEWPTWSCPKGRVDHFPSSHPAFCCAGLWWEDVDGGEPGEGRHVLRQMPSFSYAGRTRPEGVEPVYTPAFFASFPPTRLVVVAGQQSASRLDKLRRSEITAEEVDA